MTLPRRHLFACGAAAALMVLGACGGPRTPELAEPVLPPLPGTRRIVLVHSPSRERVDVVYAREGRYDATALAQINNLMRDRNTGDLAPIDPLLLDFLWDLLFRTGIAEGTEVQITSGYRSPQTNARLVSQNRNAARESFHMSGKAMDFRVPLLPGAALAEIAKTMQRGGAAYYPSTGHTHIDTGPVRTWRTK
ncbi:YcbK family protein [Indioceanicola profundi]|uniref:YcbK family protein n=1 Tax=Indioceanicola profundi TaxID=2220096 RepID=UPI000E6AE069|nr:DUF882 domain-containing protein [Indioceanicola profundi]